jgi:hypothetical protein
MSNSDNNEETSEQGKTERQGTSPLQKAIVTILWSLIGLALVSYWYVSSTMAVTVVAVVCMLAGYCRKRYQAHMLPSSFIARLSRRELYQIYVVRAVRRQGSHLLLWVALIASTFTVGNWVSSSNPVLKLEEMELRTGAVIKVALRQKVGTRKCGDRVYLKTDDGTIMKYHGLLNDDALRILRGKTTKNVTIWSQRKIKLPPCAVRDWITQVQVDTKIVDPYNINMRRKVNKWQLRLNFIYPAIGALAFWGIWLADRRAKKQQS